MSFDPVMADATQEIYDKDTSTEEEPTVPETPPSRQQSPTSPSSGELADTESSPWKPYRSDRLSNTRYGPPSSESRRRERSATPSLETLRRKSVISDSESELSELMRTPSPPPELERQYRHLDWKPSCECTGWCSYVKYTHALTQNGVKEVDELGAVSTQDGESWTHTHLPEKALANAEAPVSAIRSTLYGPAARERTVRLRKPEDRADEDHINREIAMGLLQLSGVVGDRRQHHLSEGAIRLKVAEAFKLVAQLRYCFKEHWQVNEYERALYAKLTGPHSEEGDIGHLLGSFKAWRTHRSCDTLVEAFAKMVNGHRDLLEGFSRFLPDGWKIDVASVASIYGKANAWDRRARPVQAPNSWPGKW